MPTTVAVLASLFTVLSIGGLAVEHLLSIEEELLIYVNIVKELAALLLACVALYYVRLMRKAQLQL